MAWQRLHPTCVAWQWLHLTSVAWLLLHLAYLYGCWASRLFRRHGLPAQLPAQSAASGPEEPKPAGGQVPHSEGELLYFILCVWGGAGLHSLQGASAALWGPTSMQLKALHAGKVVDDTT